MYITVKGFIKRGDCGWIAATLCPELNHHKVTVEGYYIYADGKEYMYQEKHSFTPTNAGTTIGIGIFGFASGGAGYHITAECIPLPVSGNPDLPCNNTGNSTQQAYIYGGTGTCASIGGGDAYSAVTCKSPPTKTDIRQTTNINFHWACTVSFPRHC